MRYSVATGLVLAAFSISDVIAGPTHAHLHSRHHQKKDNVDYAKVDWDNLGVDWAKAWSAGQAKPTTTPAPAPAPTTTTTSAAATTTLPAAVFKEKTPEKKVEEKPKISSANSLSDDLEDLFDGLKGASNDRTSFGEYYKIPGGSATSGALEQGDNFHGNVGKPYGSNVIKVSSKDGYDFTATFKNTQSKLITINVWNKGGSNNDNLSGASRAPKDTSLTFTLRSGQEQVVAFDKDSQIGWAEACKINAWGAFDTTWGEANFVPTGSGFDVSAIPNSRGNTYDMAISADEVSCISDMTQNFWLAAYTPIGGSDGSCYVPGSTMHLSVKMGGNVK